MIKDSVLHKGALKSSSALSISFILSMLAIITMGIFPAPSAIADTVNPLEKTYEAHGGIEKWNEMSGMSYVMEGFPLTPEVAKKSVSIVDLNTRNNRIKGGGYIVGNNGKVAWAEPDIEAVGLTPRFYTLGSFYFIGMPFVFADEGVVVSDGGTEEFDGKTYRVVNVGYRKGTGHTSKDDYVLFIDPDTDMLSLIHHSVTEVEAVDRVTWTFDEWQEVQGLLVPKKLTFYPGWNPDNPGEGAETFISDVSFSASRPDPAIYNPPSGAEVDHSPDIH